MAMVDIGNITEIFTKIVLRNDVFTTWEASTIILEKGEPALEMDLDKKVAKFKIGDGSSTFMDLPYSTLTPDEIQDMINKSMIASGEIKSVSLSSGTNNGTVKFTVNNVVYDNIAVTGLGSAAFTEVSDYATAKQGEKADISMAFKGIIDTLPDTGSIGDTYKVNADITIDAELSYTGVETIASAGDMLTLLMNGWLVVPCGKAEVAKSLEKGISATVSGAVTGSAEAANAGETLDIKITSINSDYITPGTKTIILNGGSASSM